MKNSYGNGMNDNIFQLDLSPNFLVVFIYTDVTMNLANQDPQIMYLLLFEWPLRRLGQ